MNRKYPYIGEFNGTEVKFTAPKTGTTTRRCKKSRSLNSDPYYPDNHYREDWIEEKFKVVKQLESLEFPFTVHCRDKTEMVAMKAVFKEHGLTSDIESNEFYYEYFNVFKPRYCQCYGKSDTIYPFYENAQEICELLKGGEIKEGDWVVCLNDSSGGGFVKNKVYKVIQKAGNNLYFAITGNFWNIKNFRKAKPEEIPVLPKINGYEGELLEKTVKYGCAEIDIHLLNNMVIDYRGNRNISQVVLDSGVTITHKDAENILKTINL
jgi:hypothetical protein